MAHLSYSIAVVAFVFINLGCRSSSTQLSSGPDPELNPTPNFETADPIEPMRLAMIKYKCTFGFVSQTGDSYVCIDRDKSTYIYSLLLLNKEKNEVFKNQTNNRFARELHSKANVEHYFFYENARNSRFKMNLILGKDLTPRLYSNAPEDIGAEDGPDYTLVHPDFSSIGTSDSK